MPRSNWSRKLPRPLIIPTVMRLETLADVRALIERHLPPAHRARSTWQVVATDLRASAAGGDFDELVVGLRLALMIEGVKSQLE